MMISKRKMMLGLAAVFAAAIGLPVQARAAVISSGNSQVVIDPSSQAGLSSWTIGSIDSLNQQWLWYRIGSSGPEQSIDTLNLVGTIGGATYLTAWYNDSPTTATFELIITWTLNSISDTQADLLTNITLNNLSAGPLDVSLFQYSDFDLLGSAAGDSILITGGNTATQTKGALSVQETVVSPTSSVYVAAEYDDLLVALNDGSPTTFVNDAGPYTNVNATWLFGWTGTLPAGTGSLVISKDQNLTIPEPAGIALFGTGLVLIASRQRRRA